MSRPVDQDARPGDSGWASYQFTVNGMYSFNLTERSDTDALHKLYDLMRDVGVPLMSSHGGSGRYCYGDIKMSRTTIQITN